MYDKRAAPTCASPERYAGWDVYDAMRRGFRCNKNPSRKLKLGLGALNALPTDTPAPARPTSISNRVAASEDGATTTAHDNAGTSSAAAARTTSSPPAASSELSTSTSEGGASSTTVSPEMRGSMSTESASSTVGHLSTHIPSAHKRGKNRQHRKPVGRLHHDLAQGEEGVQTKEGKYLLSDGKGGYMAVSRKSFKAAMEERRDSTRAAPATAPAAAG
ncbi:hypothetical protein FOCC_FOCC004224 [Frankliniella occidentalis]|nr:hypothetical protein FOCC_FOCC004224 [Frankliniella occidentalis]